MSATVLVSERLLRDPERKTSKAGKPFATAVLREGDGDAVTWWNLLCFSESGCEELMSLHAGDGVAASGSFKAELYEKAGAQRLSFTVVVDRIISARRQKRERAAAQRSEPLQDAGPRRTIPSNDDEIPF